jgi:hypothetical protein
MVVLLGIDVNKGTHTAVAVDEVGQKIGRCVVAATETPVLGVDDVHLGVRLRACPERSRSGWDSDPS